MDALTDPAQTFWHVDRASSPLAFTVTGLSAGNYTLDVYDTLPKAIKLFGLTIPSSGGYSVDFKVTPTATAAVPEASTSAMVQISFFGIGFTACRRNAGAALMAA